MKLAIYRFGGVLMSVGWSRAWWDYEHKGVDITHLFSVEWWSGPYKGLHFFAGPIAVGVVW